MKLTFEQIKSVTRGAACFLEQDGTLMPCRFTEAQAKAYQEIHTGFYHKVFASAGICLSFLTNSRFISLKAGLTPASSCSCVGFDVYANGALLKACSDTVTEPHTEATVFAELPGGEMPIEVTVYFPWSVSTAIRSVTLEDGALVIPVKRPLSMISFGDSITHGYVCSNPSFSYTSRVADALQAELINKGIGGEVFFPALASLKDVVEPDVITVAYGTNDFSSSTRETFERDSKAFYENLTAIYPKARIFAISPIWRQDLERTDRQVGLFSHVYDYLSQIAAGLPNVTVINGLELVPHEWRCFPKDGLHPNDEGARHYANNLYAEIKKYL